MTHQNIANLRHGSQVNSDYLVISKGELRNYNNSSKKGYWFEFVLQHHTGRIRAKYWGSDYNATENLYNSFSEGDVVNVVGYVTKTNEISISPERNGTIEVIKNARIEDYIVTVENIPWLKIHTDKLVNELRTFIDEINDPELKELVKSFFTDENFWEEFYNAPAAIKFHSAYKHGLLHHTVNVVKIARIMSELYPPVDRDLVLAGSLLHDIGKVKEYTMNYDISKTVEGGLFGHIYLGAEMVNERCRALGISDEIRRKIVHIILSHHGNVSEGYGSAVDPMMPEAVIVAMADRSDALIFQYVNAISTNYEGSDSFFRDRHLGWLYRS